MCSNLSDTNRCAITDNSHHLEHLLNWKKSAHEKYANVSDTLSFLGIVGHLEFQSHCVKVKVTMEK